MLRNAGLRKSVEQPVLDLNFAASQIGSNAAPDSRIDFSRGSNAWFVDSDGLVKKSPHNLLRRSEDLTTSWSTFQASIVANAAASPTGELTADKVVTDNSASVCTCSQSIALPDSTVFVFSGYVKAAEFTVINLQFYNKANTFHGSGNFDLTDGTRSGSPTAGTESSIENVGNGWYRITFRGLNTGTGGTNPNFRFVCNETGDGSKGFLVWGAQLSQHTTLPVDNPYIKTTGSAVYAARLDHDPTWFMSAAQEQNLLEHSEMLDDSYWTKASVNVTANAETDPLGGTTAEYIFATSPSGGFPYLQASFDTKKGAVHTVSFYAKAGEIDVVTVGIRTSGGGYVSDPFNDQALTSEWQRFSGTFTATEDTHVVRFFFGSGAKTWSGDQGFYIWGTQIEVGSTASTYHRTTGAPYYGEGATPKGLLIEEQRTNLLISSNDLTGDDGTSSTVSNTQNAALGPDGTVTAAKLAANTTTPNNGRVFYPAGGITLGAGTYTYSIFLKKAEVSFVKVRIGVSGDFPGVFFNLTNGTVGTASSGFTGRIVDYGNGYFRCSITATLSAAHYFMGVHLASADNTLLSSATVGDGVFMWGHSLELGSFPTSYIETTTTSATRNADVATMGPTVAPDKLGTELVTNGTFDTDTTGWFANNVVLSATPGQLNADDSANAGNWSAAVQELDVVTGRRYRVSFDIISLTATVSIGFRDTQSYSGGANNLDNYNTFTTTGTKTVDLTADATKPYFVIGVSGTSNAVIDNVSVKEILPGTELVTNGTFDTDVSNWNAQNSTLSHQSGKIRVTSDGGAFPQANQAFATVIGRRYRITADIDFGTSSNARVQINANAPPSTFTAVATRTADATITFDFTANHTTSTVLLLSDTSSSSAGEYQEFDNVSVRELYPFEQFNNTDGTFVLDAAGLDVPNQTVMQVDQGAINTPPFLRFSVLDGSSARVFGNISGGSNSNSFDGSLGVDTASENRVAYAYGTDPSDGVADKIQSATNGTVHTEGTTDASIGGFERVLLGSGAFFSDPAAAIKRIRYFNRRLLTQELKAITDD